MRILVLAPHADDEVLGMGGTIAKLSSEGHDVTVAILTGHGKESHPLWPRKNWDRIRKECSKAIELLGAAELRFEELPAACLDHVPTYETNGVVARVIKETQPEEVYIPFAFDLHKDHAAISYAATVALRPYMSSTNCVRRVLAYETLSETHLAPAYLAPAFQPNVFVNITATLTKKLEAMMAYSSQLQPDHLPRSIAGLKALARLRGTHIGVEAAEGFVLLGEYQR